MRLLIAQGFIRVWMRGEHVSGKLTILDWLTFLWAAWAVISSIFHTPILKELINHLGLAYDALGLYWMIRVFVQSEDDFLRITKSLLLALVPLAAELMREKLGGQNAFAIFGYVNELPEIRKGRIRANGPFSHPILAGTAGAVCIPLALLFWKRERKVALLGLAASGGMVLASASSGPIMTTMAEMGALILWKVRHRMRAIRWAAILGIIALNFIMKDPVYYLMAKIDLAGGSTGWHRAFLIDSAIKHLDEWWLGGTDFTLHWMPDPGINDHQADITNYYIVMGVVGGLPLMFLFTSFLLAGFAAISQRLRLLNESLDEQFVFWTLGAILFGHAITFFSIPYFDQTVVFLYFLLASISSLTSTQLAELPVAEEAAVYTPSQEGMNGLPG